MGLTLKKPSEALQKFLVTQHDPREDLASGYYDFQNEYSPIKCTLEDSESSCCLTNDLQLLEKRLDNFFDAEGVHCVMLQDYLKALSLHTEQERFFKPKHGSKNLEIGVFEDN